MITFMVSLLVNVMLWSKLQHNLGREARLQALLERTQSTCGEVRISCEWLEVVCRDGGVQ